MSKSAPRTKTDSRFFFIKWNMPDRHCCVNIKTAANEKRETSFGVERNNEERLEKRRGRKMAPLPPFSGLTAHLFKNVPIWQLIGDIKVKGFLLERR
jgi:hypothetical protein